ncbi:MAG: FkbM family methyltransferase [Lewinellaceae bacterium]|nr:FkbM family methyltransferase [Lewinellaceae bacterium]
MKAAIKRLLKLLPIAFTQNQRYDRQTLQVIRKVCTPGCNCIDVGCHKGEILDQFIKYAPGGTHFGYEPIPRPLHGPREKYAGVPNCHLFDIALSDRAGTSSFNYVVSNPSYSGLVKRTYDHPNEQDTQITVKTERLDALIPADRSIDLIKIDVEGGELLVLKGAVRTLERCKPVVIFEHGLGASELYGATPEQVYDLLDGCGLQVSLMGRFIRTKPRCRGRNFAGTITAKLNYYFIAYP